MKNPSGSLYNLIHSLTSDERGYFRKNASSNIQGGTKAYIKLFNEILQTKEYNEMLLKKTFSEEKFAKHFWKIKTYLYKTILKSLRDYHSENVRELKTNKVLDNLYLLLEKGLYNDSKKLLSKTKKMCYDYELYAPLLRLLVFEKKLMVNTRHSGLNEKDIKKHFEEVNKATEKINNWNEYQYNSSRLFLLIKKKSSVKSWDDLKDIYAIMQQPIYKDVNNAVTFEAKLSFHKAHYYYYYLACDYENCYSHSEKMLELFESSGIKMKSRPDAYVKLLANHLEVCLQISRFDRFQIYFEKVRAFESVCVNKADAMNIVYLNLELEYYIKTGKYGKGLQMIDKINDVTNSLQGAANEMMKCSVYYNIAYLYFLKNDFHKSIYYLNKILHDSKVKDEIEIFYYARLLNLIVHYEIGSFTLLESILKSTYRYLYKRQRVYKFEKQIYRFIKSLFNVKSEKKLIKSFDQLKHSLEEILFNPFENGALDYIDLVSWLESKITNRKFSDVLDDKLKHVA